MMHLPFAVELGAVAAISTDRDYLGFNVPRIFWPGDVHLAYAVPGKLQFVQAAITLLGTDFHAKGKEVDIQGHGKKTAYFRKHGVFDMDNMYEDFVGCVGQVAGDLDKIWRGMVSTHCLLEGRCMQGCTFAHGCGVKD